jgi:hypothetical protein
MTACAGPLTGSLQTSLGGGQLWTARTKGGLIRNTSETLEQLNENCTI